jgi:itaconate CoA-transferase
MYAYSNILAALFRRERTDEGVAIEVTPSRRSPVGWASPPTTPYTGREPAHRGTSYASMASYGPFMCAGSETMFLDIENDGSVRDSARSYWTVRDWPKMRFSGNSDRLANRDALDEEIEETFGRLTAARAIEKFERPRIANARKGRCANSWIARSYRPATAGAKWAPLRPHQCPPPAGDLRRRAGDGPDPRG